MERKKVYNIHLLKIEVIAVVSFSEMSRVLETGKPDGFLADFERRLSSRLGTPVSISITADPLKLAG